MVARVAVSRATYLIDRLYDYSVPRELESKIAPGVRVFVPFSAGNRSCEGIVLAVAETSEYKKLKSILSVPDGVPALTEGQIKLALFMRSHFFCTVYEAVHTILPAGFWLDKDGKRKIKDAFVETASLSPQLANPDTQAEKLKKRAPQQASLLETLADFEALPVRELLTYSGASRSALKSLEQKGFITIEKQGVYRRAVKRNADSRPIPVLNSQQQSVFDALSAKLRMEEPSVSLLHGVTGSGKTGIYACLINEALSEGKGAILLVPEIALTPQMINTFSGYFGDRVAVLHSSLTDGERFDEWKRINSGDAPVVIGTRSAVFAPVPRLGIIIIDEEQEDTYKSENAPRYSTSDIARFRCFENRIPLLLGSATPKLVTMYNAATGVYGLHTLKERYNSNPLPEVIIADMCDELRAGNGSDISRVLAVELEKNIANGEQSIIFINRRGANRLITCGSCGFVYECPRCSVSLTYHSTGNRLICHHCGYSRRVDSCCPECGGILNYVGTGTQKIVQQLEDLFPNTEIMRMDADSVALFGGHEYMFDRFINEKIPILIGTQMVSKGLNFENVTLVGVISADQSLYSGDYRAAERTFSMITQVVGRSGRGSKPGRAVIQTFTPDNPVIRCAAAQDYDAFYKSELEFRRLQLMPPFSRLVRIALIGDDEEKTYRCGMLMADKLKRLFSSRTDTRILGPAPMPIEKLNNRYRFAVLVSGSGDAVMRKTIATAVTETRSDKSFNGMTIYADSDPL